MLLVQPAGDARAGARREWVDAVLRFADKVLPAPDRTAIGADAPRAPAPAKPAAGAIPEDPEGDEPLFADVRSSAAEVSAATWGAGTRALDTGVATVFVLRGPEDYAALLEVLPKAAPYLADWIGEARAAQGFSLSEPLAAAFLLAAPDLEEWDPDAELVHRLARLLLARRFGEQPYWVAAGWSWHAELELRGSIYCFPYREGFVGIGEHGGWGSLLASRFGARAPDWAEVAELERGRWDDAAAGLAWGAVTWLARERAAALPVLLERFRQAWDLDNRRAAGDGKWLRDRDYVLPREIQRALLDEVLGPAALGEFGAWCAAGGEAPGSGH